RDRHRTAADQGVEQERQGRQSGRQGRVPRGGRAQAQGRVRGHGGDPLPVPGSERGPGPDAPPVAQARLADRVPRLPDGRLGAGHNGLVTAAYLARAGRKVLVLERRDVIGGACVTEELWPGYKVSTAAYVNSLLRPEIIRDLELKKHGFEMLPRSPSSFTPFPDGRFLLMGPDKELTRQQVAKFSDRDAEALPRY